MKIASDSSLKQESRIEKEKYFDLYWATRNPQATPKRILQRAVLASRLLGKSFGKLLDVGCGTGVIAEYFKSLGFEVEGVDISPEAVKMTRKRGIPAKVLDLDVERLSFSYDVILALEILQFVVHPERVLANLKAILNPNGELIVSLPNEFHLGRRIKILFGKPDLGGFDAPHIRFFSLTDQKRLFEHCNLKIVSKINVPLFPPRWKFLSWIGQFLADFWPGLFSLSTVFKLQVE